MRVTVQLGIDVGGTASRWVARAGDGTIVSRGKAGGASAHMFNPLEHARLNSALAMIAAALADQNLGVEHVVAGLTGYGAAAGETIAAMVAEQLGVDARNIRIIDDITLAFRSVFEPGEGHLVSAGTGSIGLHIGADNAQLRVGGRGILIDDAGSGSWIALQAWDQLYRSHDHSGGFDAAPMLARHLFNHVGGDSWNAVRAFIYGGDRGRIGTLAVAVARAAEDGDAVATQILHQAGAELALLAQALVTRAGPRPIAFIGGVLDLHPGIGRAIAENLAGHDIRMVRPDAALAAARMACGASTI